MNTWYNSKPINLQQQPSFLFLLQLHGVSPPCCSSSSFHSLMQPATLSPCLQLPCQQPLLALSFFTSSSHTLLCFQDYVIILTSTLNYYASPYSQIFSLFSLLKILGSPLFLSIFLSTFPPMLSYVLFAKLSSYQNASLFSSLTHVVYRVSLDVESIKQKVTMLFTIALGVCFLETWRPTMLVLTQMGCCSKEGGKAMLLHCWIRYFLYENGT